MASMVDNVRSWWISLSESLGNPSKLAQLSVADLEKAIRKAKEAASPVIGRPVVLESKLKDLKQMDRDLTDKITTLIQTGASGQEAAVKYVERQVSVRKEIENVENEYQDAKAASEEWQSKIRTLETELYTRRNEANKLEAQFETAKAEQALGRQMQNVDSLMGSDTFSTLQARVDKERAKAAGLSTMSGLNTKVNDEKIIRDAQTESLMNEYLNKLNSNQ